MVRLIKACLNGARRRGDHPALPVTDAQLADAAAACVAAGAEAVHLHPRDDGGEQSLAAVDVGAAVTAVRARCPTVPVGVSTGLWIAGGDPRARLELAASWADLEPGARPDFASVNLSEPGFTELADRLESAGIGVEAGVWTPEDADALGGREVLRALVEIIGGPAETAVARADEVLTCLDRVGSTAPRLLHGEDAACWPLVAHAGRLGLPTRIGLEDTLVDDTGAPAPDNAALVRRALELHRRAAATH